MRFFIPRACLSSLIFVGLIFSQLVNGQVIVWKAGQKDFAKPTTAAESNTVGASESESDSQERMLRLSPMAEASPALKYRFWKSPALRQPGSVNALVSRAVIQYLSLPKRSKLDEQYVKRAGDWVERHMDVEGLKAHVNEQREVLNTLYDAANLQTIEMEQNQRNKKGSERFAANIAEIQNLRNLARLLQLDGYLAIVERRYEDAIRTINTGFCLAEVAQHSGDANMISGLVSIAISGITFTLVEELIQQADAPNLYWALASLPEHLWNQRSWIDGEYESMSSMLYPLLEPATANMTASDWSNRLIVAAETIVVTSGLEDVPNSSDNETAKGNLASANLFVGAALLIFSDRAAQELVASGIANEQVQRMSPAEVVGRITKIEFDSSRDALFKWTLIPSFNKSYSEKTWEEFKQRLGGNDFFKPANILCGLLIPALQASDSAALRLSSTHKQLLLIEALRAHAALNDGKLPESLLNLQPVPTWPNPESGELFEYERVNDTEAIVRRKPMYPGEISVTRIIVR